MTRSAAARPPVTTMFRRALLLRCPRCGGAGVLASWFKLKERCPTCRLALERGEREDFWLGAYAINMVVAETIALLGTLVYMRATWPETPYAVPIGVALAVIMPIAFFPFSRTFWLAWDLSFRPSEPGD
jgi:uncharacterized protein (DUF983 family)